MGKNRTVVLFGAGAAYDWGGPKTEALTESIRNSGFCCYDNDTRITEFIFQALVTNGYKETDITFETIINVIEELMIYYSSFDKDKEIPSLQKTFFDSKFEKILLNYSIDGDILRHGFKLNIPRKKTYNFQHSGAINKETPSQYFFQLLLATLLTDINGAISSYAYHTDHYSQILTVSNQHINQLFFNWLNKLEPDKCILRLYSLNYDRIFKILALKSGLKELFEGFECGATIAPGYKIPANIPRILTDFDTHCHYNLHGSAFWRIEPRDKGLFANAEIFLQGSPSLQINLSEQPYIQIEKGKSILITNIITGYQKAQKGFLTPFKQMQTAFDRDCIFADNLYVIGYSFGDEHINMSIKTALKYNPNIKIHIVDPAYEENTNKGYDLLVDRFLNVFTHFLQNRGQLKKINDNCCQYFDGKITVHTMSMNEYLKSQE
jgi:hypothetical protein